MKIAILTQRLTDNYGGILQNYALQQVLIGLGHTPETIDYQQLSKAHRKKMIVEHYKSLFSLHYHPKQYPLPSKLPSEKRMAHTRNFVKKHILTTPPTTDIEPSIWEVGAYDAYIVGSDQVWRPAYNSATALRAMFLSDLNVANIPRVAYAASFGVDNWEFTPEDTEMARDAIKKFSGVSVRESTGINLCKEFLGCTAVQVLDPTMLLDRSHYASLLKPKQLKAIADNSIGAYILDHTPEKQALLDNIALQLGMPVEVLGNVNYAEPQLPVEHWLSAFMRAGYIVTDSFHGVAFAINFNIPFTVIDNPDRGSARIDSILKTFNLENRRNLLDVDRQIDWDSVNSIKGELRSISLDFLVRALSVSNV